MTQATDISQDAQDSARAAERIAALVLAAPEDEALDMLAGQLQEFDAPRHPLLYFLIFERMAAAGRLLEAVTVWRHYADFLRRDAGEINRDDSRYGLAVDVLGRFIDAFDRGEEDFSAFHVFSEEISRALDHFDAVTMNKTPASASATPAPDTLMLGDRCLAEGDDVLAAAFYRRAAEDEDEPEGWLRLLQLMAEADLGPEGSLEKAAAVLARALEAGFWHARPYYMIRALSATEEGEEETPPDAEVLADLAEQAKAFVQDFVKYIQPSQKGFSKYTTPPLFENVTGIYDQARGEDVIRKLHAVTAGSGIKAAVGAYAQAAAFMLMQNWITPRDLAGLDAALAAFLDALTEENRLIAESVIAEHADDSPQGEEQRRFSEAAMRINVDVAAQIESLRALLTESP